MEVEKCNCCRFVALALVIFLTHLHVGYSYHTIILKKKISHESANHNNVKNILQNLIIGTKSRLKAAPIKEYLNNYQNVQYYGQVTIGSPGQTFNMLFDTGSDLIWIPSLDSHDSSCANGHSLFQSHLSTTYQSFNKSLYYPYLKGDVTVNIGSDSVKVGDITVRKQTLGVALKGHCVGEVFDGIVGMSFTQNKGRVTLVENMYRQGLITEPIFAFYLNRDSKSEVESELTFGGYNPARIKNNQLHTVQTISTTSWTVLIDTVTLGNKTIAKSQRAIIDTGTSLIGVSLNTFQTIVSTIGTSYSEGISYVDCKESSNLLDLSFKMGNKTFTLHSRDYVLENLKVSSYCIVGISAIDVEDDTWIFGDVFLHRYYSVFDIHKRTISFANISDSGVPLRSAKVLIFAITLYIMKHILILS